MTEAPAAGIVESGETKSAEGSFELPALDFSAPETATESAYASSAPEEMNETKEAPAEQELESSIVSQVETHAAEEAVHHAKPAAAIEAPDMDALVARVLAKISPEVLQRVTQEILKPVIEALIKDELASKR